jgi:L-threonylcarbamoyladenylate synthase
MPTVLRGDGEIELVASQKVDQEKLTKALEAISNGGIVVYPTETFYALGVDAWNPEALAKLAKLKKRPQNKPFSLILGSGADLGDLAHGFPVKASKLVARAWPGPLTVVVWAQEKVHQLVKSEDQGVAVRISPCFPAWALAEQLGGPITATSANLAGGEPITQIADLDPAIREAADYIWDEGPTKGAPATTILDVRQAPFKVLRQGGVEVPAELLS